MICLNSCVEKEGEIDHQAVTGRGWFSFSIWAENLFPDLLSSDLACPEDRGSAEGASGKDAEGGTKVSSSNARDNFFPLSAVPVADAVLLMPDSRSDALSSTVLVIVFLEAFPKVGFRGVFSLSLFSVKGSRSLGIRRGGRGVDSAVADSKSTDWELVENCVLNEELR